MHPVRAAAAVAIALVGVLAVGGCGGAAPGGAPSTTAAAPASSATPIASGSGSDQDACDPVPAAPLRAATGADPGAGVASTGEIGGRCTWTVSAGHVVVVELTAQPDAFLPDAVIERPDSAADVPGADRGFAAAESRTILVVKGGRGLLLHDLGLGEAAQPAYDALAAAIAARL